MDLRIKKTYRALFDAFTELLEEHRFDTCLRAVLDFTNAGWRQLCDRLN